MSTTTTTPALDPGFAALLVLAPARPGASDNELRRVLERVRQSLASGATETSGYAQALSDTRRPAWFRLALALTTGDELTAAALVGHFPALVKERTSVAASPAWSALTPVQRLRLGHWAGARTSVKGPDLLAYASLLKEDDAETLQGQLARCVADASPEDVVAARDVLGTQYRRVLVEVLTSGGHRPTGEHHQLLLSTLAEDPAHLRVLWDEDVFTESELLSALVSGDVRERVLAAVVSRAHKRKPSLYRDLLLAREEATAWALESSWRSSGSLDLLLEVLSWAEPTHDVVVNLLECVTLKEWTDKPRAAAALDLMGSRVDLAARSLIRKLSVVDAYGPLDRAVLDDLDPRLVDSLLSDDLGAEFAPNAYDESRDKAIAAVVRHTKFVPTRKVVSSYGGWSTEALRGSRAGDEDRRLAWLRLVDVPVLTYLCEPGGPASRAVKALLGEALERAQTPQARTAVRHALTDASALAGLTLLEYADELRRLEAHWVRAK
jgi:hypothetical protein